MQLLETIRALDGVVSHLPYHQKRLENSLAKLGFSNRIDLGALLDPPKEGLFRCRVIYDEHGAEVSYHSYAPRCMRSLRAVIDDAVVYDLKYADRSALDRLFALRGEADDVLIVKDGMVTDTTIANVAFFDGTRWLTPETPLLQGTTRARLLEEGLISEAPIFYADIDRYERCAVMNAMVGFVEIENGIIAPSKP